MSVYRDAYNLDVQHLLLGYLIGDPDGFATCRGILQDVYFDDSLRPAVRFVLDYTDSIHALPTPAQIFAKTGLTIAAVAAVGATHRKWFLKEIESFVRHRALELAILQAVELLQTDEGGEIERRIRAALTISLMRDIGTSYFDNPRARLEAMRDNSAFVSTGWPSVDQKLNGGFVRGALNIFAAGRGAGKSLTLQNLALNWARAGLHVVYISLELSEELVGLRIDAMLTSRSTQEIMHDVEGASRVIALKGQDSGSITIKRLPQAGTTTNVMRAYLKEYEIKTGRRPDGLLLDYLDLIYPNDRRIDPSNLFIKDKYTSEEVRDLVTEWDLLCASASQFNRSGVEAQEFDHNHIAGGISKIDTADTLIGVLATPSMKERGVFQFQFLKTRTAAAVGQNIEMAYDPTSMRITDKPAVSKDRPKATAALKTEVRAELRVIGGTAAGDGAAPASLTAASALSRLLAMRDRVQDGASSGVETK